MTRPISVLLVDDNPYVCESVSAWLEDDGFDVRTAAGGAEALQALASAPIDVAMVDLALPDMNGEEFIAQAIRRHPESRFLIHTGAHCYRLSLELQNLGMQEDDVVYKPVLSLGLLSGKIRRKAG